MNDYRILVVDDEEDLCEILKFNLENEGYFVDTANSAEEALKMELTQYNLLLLDVMMGEISGFKMANMLKKNKATASIPIIFITAKDTENDTVTGFNLGADDLFFFFRIETQVFEQQNFTWFQSSSSFLRLFIS